MMASAKRDGLPSFWTTHLAKVLSGDQPCYRQAWLQGHFNLEKRPRTDDGSLATWKANHTEMLRVETEKYRAAGWKCDVERFFRVTGQHAIISGKADLIAQKPDMRPRIIDTKSGKERGSDITQVLVETILIPMAWNVPSMQFEGVVVYPHGEVIVTPKDAAELKPKLFERVKWLGMLQVKPEPSPSESTCRFCDVNDQDCPDRFVGSAPEVTTNEF